MGSFPETLIDPMYVHGDKQENYTDCVPHAPERDFSFV